MPIKNILYNFETVTSRPGADVHGPADQVAQVVDRPIGRAWRPSLVRLVGLTDLVVGVEFKRLLGCGYAFFL